MRCASGTVSIQPVIPVAGRIISILVTIKMIEASGEAI